VDQTAVMRLELRPFLLIRAPKSQHRKAETVIKSVVFSREVVRAGVDIVGWPNSC
jgi:hypothetical protein